MSDTTRRVRRSARSRLHQIAPVASEGAVDREFTVIRNAVQGGNSRVRGGLVEITCEKPRIGCDVTPKLSLG
jgi:hypothetical protein